MKTVWVRYGFCAMVAAATPAMGAQGAPFVMAPAPTALAADGPIIPHAIKPQTATPSVPPSLGKLMHLQSEVDLLSLQLKIAKLRAAIAHAHNAPQGTTKHAGFPRGLMNHPIGPQGVQNTPRVRSITGNTGRLSAVIEMAGRQTLHVHVGQYITSHLRVTRITAHSVWVHGPHGSYALPWRAPAVSSGLGGIGSPYGSPYGAMAGTPGNGLIP